MFAENGKISARQTFRLYVFDLMGIATLLLPPYLAALCGVDGIWAILIGSGLGFLYLAYLAVLIRKMGTDILGFLQEGGHGILRGFLCLAVGLHGIITAGFLSFVFARLMGHSLIREVSYELILLVIIFVSLYAVSGGVECRARVYEILFWIVLLPYAAMVLASVRDVEPVYLSGFFEAEPIGFLKGIYLVFLMVTPVFFSLFLLKNKEKDKFLTGLLPVANALGVTAIVLLGSYVLLLGNFGADSLAQMRFPIISLMSTVQFEGNFLKRMDAIMVAVWFFTLFALLNLHVHYGVNLMHKMYKKEKGNAGLKWLLPVGLLVYGIAWGMEYAEGMMDMFLDYYSYIAMPGMIVLPGLLVLLCQKTIRKKKNLSIIGLFICVSGLFTLSACNKAELEERCFPLVVAVDDEEEKLEFSVGFPRAENGSGSTGQASELEIQAATGDDFKESKENYENNLSKKPDYNHLKVLVLGMDVATDKKQCDSMLKYLAGSEEFPRNTYICVVEDVEELLQIDKELPQDLGTYLEEYLVKHEEKKNRLLSLGDMIDEMENEKLVLYAPYLVPGENYVEWGGYYALGSAIPPVDFE